MVQEVAGVIALDLLNPNSTTDSFRPSRTLVPVVVRLFDYGLGGDHSLRCPHRGYDVVAARLPGRPGTRSFVLLAFIEAGGVGVAKGVVEDVREPVVALAEERGGDVRIRAQEALL